LTRGAEMKTDQSRMIVFAFDGNSAQKLIDRGRPDQVNYTRGNVILLTKTFSGRKLNRFSGDF